MKATSGVGCFDGPVTGISSGLGLEVMAGVGLAGREITGTSVDEAGAHANNIKKGIKSRVGRIIKRILSFIFNIFSTKRYQ
jgi:hypothetical protein